MNPPDPAQPAQHPAPQATPPHPGDEAAPGTPGSGEAVCGHCSGRGVMPDGSACEVCGGSGKVIEGIGGG